VLRQVYEKQLDGVVTSVDEGIEEARRILIVPPDAPRS
jgi:hypothetical protein